MIKDYTHLDAHSFFVHHSGDTHKPKAYIKWEGYILDNIINLRTRTRTKEEQDEYETAVHNGDFSIHYFDDIFRYTEWIAEINIFHMGNVSYISEEEYMKAYHHMMEDCY